MKTLEKRRQVNNEITTFGKMAVTFPETFHRYWFYGYFLWGQRLKMTNFFREKIEGSGKAARSNPDETTDLLSVPFISYCIGTLGSLPVPDKTLSAQVMEARQWKDPTMYYEIKYFTWYTEEQHFLLVSLKSGSIKRWKGQHKYLAAKGQT